MSLLQDKILFLGVTLQQKKFILSDMIVSNVWGGVNMYNKMEICNCRVETEGDASYVFRYYLYESTKKITVNATCIEVPCYGIEITSEKLVKGRLEEIFSDRIDVVSSVKDKVIDLIEFLKNNEVSPVHLFDIAGDYADEWIEDFDKEAKSIMESVSLN